MGIEEQRNKLEMSKGLMQTIYGPRLPDKRLKRNVDGDPDFKKIGDPNKLWQRHHEILNLHMLGYKNEEIAAKLGITPTSVSQIVNSQLGRHKIDTLRLKRDEATYDVMVEVKKLAADAVKVYENILKDDEDTSVAMLNLKKRTADTVLGIQGFSDKKVEVKGTVSHVFGSSKEIQEALERGLEFARKEGLICDAEYEEVKDGEAGCAGLPAPDNSDGE